MLYVIKEINADAVKLPIDSGETDRKSVQHKHKECVEIKAQVASITINSIPLEWHTKI